MNRTHAIAAIFLIGALTACDRSSQQAAPQATTAASAAQPARGPWPFLAAEPAAARDFDARAVIKRQY
jgi:hypothetical protein